MQKTFMTNILKIINNVKNMEIYKIFLGLGLIFLVLFLLSTFVVIKPLYAILSISFFIIGDVLYEDKFPYDY